MTDNEIIKALKCCGNYNDCDKCDFEPKDNKKKTIGCCLETMKNALDLITRQQAEIENYKHLDVILHTAIDKLSADIKSEAVKEFAERLKERYSNRKSGQWSFEKAFIKNINNLLKEMVGENNG